MKARWSEVEAQVRAGATFEVINRGRPTVRIIPAAPRPILAWEDHLATAIPAAGRTSEETIAAARLQDDGHFPCRLRRGNRGDSLHQL